MHRYYPERIDLIRALAVHVHALSSAAIEQADPTCGPPVEALRRVVESQLDLGPIVLFAYNEPTIVSDPELDGPPRHRRRGHHRGARPGVHASATEHHPGWARRVFWALLQAGYEAAKQDGTPRHQIVDAIMASLTEGTINPDHANSSTPQHVSSGVIHHVHPPRYGGR